MSISPTDRVLPNRRLRCVMLGIQDVMGRNGLNATLKLAGLQRYVGNMPPASGSREIRASEFAAMIQAIETQLGSGARGQLNRIGHAAFRQIVASEKTAWNLIAFVNRFLPPRQRMQRALAQLAKHISDPDGKAGVYSDDQRLLFADDTSDSTQGRKRSTEICWLTLGEIQECISWATGGNYDVTEVACKAKGDPGCKFEIGEKLG